MNSTLYRQAPTESISFLRYWLTVCFFLLASTVACSIERDVWIFQSDDSLSYNAAYNKLAETVAVAPLKLIRLKPDDKLPAKKPAFIIAIGASAAERVFTLEPECPALIMLITESGFKELATTYKKTVNAAYASNYSALVLEQPLLRYFSLGKLLVPNSKKVGVLIGPNTEYRLLEAETVASVLGLELFVARIDNNRNPVAALETVIKQVDFFVAVPDTDAINKTTARWLIELSYRHAKPVIAYSARYAESGALAGIFTTPESQGREAGQWLLQSLVTPPKNGQLSGPQDLQITLNPAVAKANAISLKDAAYYKELLVTTGISP